MICPHCNKEVESYTVYGQNASLNQGCAGGVLSYTYTVGCASGMTASPTLLGEVTLTPAYSASNTVSANQQLGHYHMI